MDYSADNARFESDMKEQIPNVAGHIPFAAGIGNYLIKDPQDVARQIEIARQNGADGYALFAYNDDNIDAVLAAVKTANAVPAIPSYRAPRAKWEIAGGIARRDAPTAFAAGESATVSARFSWPRGVWKSVTTQVLLESADSSQPLPNATSGRANISVPTGLSQLVARGQARDANGKSWPIAVRGPLIEGLTSSEMSALKARDLPPHFAPDKRNVAIYAGGQASAGLLKNLRDAPGVDAELIYALRPALWKNAKVLILPHLEDVQDLTPDVIRDLRQYVSDGGKLILTHDAVGYRWHARLFPEIGVGVARLDGTQIVVQTNDFGVTPGAITQGYADHVLIEAAPTSMVVARETASNQPSHRRGPFRSRNGHPGRRFTGRAVGRRDARAGKTVAVGIGALN